GVDLLEIRGLAAFRRALVHDLELQFLGCAIDDCHVCGLLRIVGCELLREIPETVRELFTGVTDGAEINFAEPRDVTWPLRGLDGDFSCRAELHLRGVFFEASKNLRHERRKCVRRKTGRKFLRDDQAFLEGDHGTCDTGKLAGTQYDLRRRSGTFHGW